MAMDITTKRAFLLISVLVLLVQGIVSTSVDEVADEDSDQYICPNGCSCIVVQKPNSHPYKHAKCLSIDDLRGKTLPIQSLDLSDVGLERISNQLEKLKNLTKLNLSHNRLSEVGRLNRRIRDLDLGHNRIVSGKISKLPQFIQKLDLSHNEITVLPLDFKKFEKLKELELAGNPLNCSCETLQVRNWLQANHVWSNKVIKCTYPLKYKGRPWLQVKEADVCDSDDQERNIWDEDSNNELMMGDQPAASGSGEKDDELIEEDYLLYQKQHEDDAEYSNLPHYDGSGGDDTEEVTAVLPSRVADVVEGSGTGIGRVRGSVDSVDVTTAQTDDEYDEGSGGGIFVPRIRFEDGPATDDSPKTDIVTEDEPSEEQQPIEEPSEETTRVPLTLGIFGKDHPSKVDETTNGHSADADGSEIIPKDDSSMRSGAVPPTEDTKGNLQEIEKTDKADSKKLYILLGVIGLVMVALIIYVAINQRKSSRRNNRRRQEDVERAKETELQDMNKRLIGKPLEKNGNSENVPLMPKGDKTDYAKPINGNNKKDDVAFNPYQQPETPITPVTQPLLKEEPRLDEKEPQKPALNSFRPNEKSDSNDSLQEINNKPNNTREDDPNNNQFKPITNGYPHENGLENGVPSPTRSESPAEVHKGPNQELWDKYTPKSPNLKRYSPVYSPETGRVKIKLTETPKPKTPMLVTRSRSNAGQYITTPNLSQRSPAKEEEES